MKSCPWQGSCWTSNVGFGAIHSTYQIKVNLVQTEFPQMCTRIHSRKKVGNTTLTVHIRLHVSHEVQIFCVTIVNCLYTIAMLIKYLKTFVEFEVLD